LELTIKSLQENSDQKSSELIKQLKLIEQNYESQLRDQKKIYEDTIVNLKAIHLKEIEGIIAKHN